MDLIMSLSNGSKSSKMELPTLTDPGEHRKRSDDLVEKYSSRKFFKTMRREDLPEDPGESEEFSVKADINNQSYNSLLIKPSMILPKSAKKNKNKFISQKKLQSLKSFNSISKPKNTIKQITDLYKNSNKSLIRVDIDKKYEFQNTLNLNQTHNLKGSKRSSFRFQSDDELNTSKYMNFKNKILPLKNPNNTLNLGSRDYERTKFKMKTNKTFSNMNLMKVLSSNVSKMDTVNNIKIPTEFNYFPTQKLEKAKKDLANSYNSFNSINKSLNFNAFNQKANIQTSQRLHTSESLNSPNRKIINLPYVDNIKLKINEAEGINSMGMTQVGRNNSSYEIQCSLNTSRSSSEDLENHESQEDYSIKINKKNCQKELSSSYDSETEERLYKKNIKSRGKLKSKFLNQEIKSQNKSILDNIKKEKFSNLKLKNLTKLSQNVSNFESSQNLMTNESTQKSQTSNTKKNLLKFTDQAINDAKSLYSIKKNRTSKKVVINTNNLKGKNIQNEDSTYNKTHSKTKVISSVNLSEGEDEQIKNKIVNIVNNVNPKQDSKIEVELNINRYDIKLIHSNLDDIISQHSDISSSILEYSRELIRKLKKSDSVENKVIHGKNEYSMDKSNLFKRVNTINPNQKFYFNEKKESNQNFYGTTLDEAEINSNRNPDNIKKKKKIVINKRISKGYLRNEFSKGVKEEKKENETENEINKEELVNISRKKEEEIKFDSSGNNNEIYSITIKTETEELSQSRPSTSSHCEDTHLYIKNTVKYIFNNVVENFVGQIHMKNKCKINFKKSNTFDEENLKFDIKKLKQSILADENCKNEIDENLNNKLNNSLCEPSNRSKLSINLESSTSYFNKFSIIENPVKYEYEKFQALIENFDYTEKFESSQKKMKDYLLVKPNNWLNTECEFVKEELMSRVIRFFRISTNSKIKDRNKKILKKRILNMYKYGLTQRIFHPADDDLCKENFFKNCQSSGRYLFSSQRSGNIGLMKDYIEDNYFNYYRTVIEALYVESYLSEEIKISRVKTILKNFARKTMRRKEQFSILKIMKNKLKSDKKEEIKIEEGKNKKTVIWLQGMDHFERGESKQEDVIRYFKQIVRRNKIDRVKKKYEYSKGNHDESSGQSDDSIIKRVTENKIRKLENNVKSSNNKINIRDLQTLRRLSKNLMVKKTLKDFSILHDEDFFQVDSKEKFLM
jgi:hypothetical protein